MRWRLGGRGPEPAGAKLIPRLVPCDERSGVPVRSYCGVRRAKRLRKGSLLPEPQCRSSSDLDREAAEDRCCNALAPVCRHPTLRSRTSGAPRAIEFFDLGVTDGLADGSAPWPRPARRPAEAAERRIVLTLPANIGDRRIAFCTRSSNIPPVSDPAAAAPKNVTTVFAASVLFNDSPSFKLCAAHPSIRTPFRFHAWRGPARPVSPFGILGPRWRGRCNGSPYLERSRSDGRIS